MVYSLPLSIPLSLPTTGPQILASEDQSTVRCGHVSVCVCVLPVCRYPPVPGHEGDVTQLLRAEVGLHLREG